MRKNPGNVKKVKNPRDNFLQFILKDSDQDPQDCSVQHQPHSGFWMEAMQQYVKQNKSIGKASD